MPEATFQAETVPGPCKRMYLQPLTKLVSDTDIDPDIRSGALGGSRGNV